MYCIFGGSPKLSVWSSGPRFRARLTIVPVFGDRGRFSAVCCCCCCVSGRSITSRLESLSFSAFYSILYSTNCTPLYKHCTTSKKLLYNQQFCTWSWYMAAKTMPFLTVYLSKWGKKFKPDSGSFVVALEFDSVTSAVSVSLWSSSDSKHNQWCYEFSTKNSDVINDINRPELDECSIASASDESESSISSCAHAEYI